MYGPTGIIVGVGAGLLRVIYVNKDLAAQIVPVDMCVNNMLAIAWDVAKNTYEEPPIYNFVTNDSNQITWDTYTTLGVKHGSKTPLSKSIWFYAFSLTASKTKAQFLKFFYHIIPALIMDMGLFCVGKKPK
jgi:fatty acyl-CoA reductase